MLRIALILQVVVVLAGISAGTQNTGNFSAVEQQSESAEKVLEFADGEEPAGVVTPFALQSVALVAQLRVSQPITRNLAMASQFTDEIITPPPLA